MLLIVAAATAQSCATVTTADGERLPIASDRFAAYAESVFRQQNRVATELAFALEDTPASAAGFGELEAAEEALLRECASLNAAASAARDGGRLALRGRLDAARQAPDCERAAAAAAAVLREHQRS